MNQDLLPTPESLTLIEVTAHFDTDDKARAYLEAIRWPKGPVCAHCGNAKQDTLWRIAANPTKKIRPGLIQCGECKKQFTVTVNTIFENSHIPLRKWLIAWYLFAASKKGIAALELQRILGLGSYRSALFMTHRIRHTIKDPQVGGIEKLDGTIEMDETYIGGKRKYVGKGYKGNKIPVVSLVQRDGKARSRVMACVTGNNLKKVLQDNVVEGSRVYTDQFRAYPRAAKGFRHARVNHSAGEYVRGDVHTNSVEGFFSMLKRGVIGTFHHVSQKHLPLYLSEFDFRHNTRKLTDGERTVEGLRMMEGKRLQYKEPA